MSKTGDLRMATALWVLLVVVWSCDQAAKADFNYGEPSKVPNVSRAGAGGPHISRDGLELYFVCKDQNPWSDIWVSTRSTTKEPWATPVRLDFPPGSARVIADGVCTSSDGLELYFGEGYPVLVQRVGAGWAFDPNGYGNGDLWVSRRAAKGTPWGKPENLGPVINTSGSEGTPCISADGLSLYFASERPYPFGGGIHLYVATRQTLGDPWGAPVMLDAPIKTATAESCPFISPDGRSLYYSVGWGTDNDIYVSKRPTADEPWGTPVKFGPVNSSLTEYFLSFSTEVSAFYFFRASGIMNRSTYDVYQVQVFPIVDFSADGKVDLVDLVMLIENWGTSATLYDIGPAPLGDGKVDIEDLKVFMTYYEKENPPVKP